MLTRSPAVRLPGSSPRQGFRDNLHSTGSTRRFQPAAGGLSHRHVVRTVLHTIRSGRTAGGGFGRSHALCSGKRNEPPSWHGPGHHHEAEMQKALALLTPEQADRWHELTGPRFADLAELQDPHGHDESRQLN